jgi:hypothetical protein
MHPSAHSQFLRRLELRWLSVVVTFCAKHMEWFGALFLWFKGIGDHAGGNFAPFIAFFLSIPCFKLSRLMLARTIGTTS